MVTVMFSGPTISIGISILALVVSAATLWLTHLYRGRLRMTKPTVIFFGPDGGKSDVSKIFLRTLFFSTSQRGKVIESMFVRLRRGESSQNFSIWVYGDDKMVRGSGLFVGHEGVATNHHFLTPADVKDFDFKAGDYKLDVFAKVVERRATDHMATIDLRISQTEAEQLKERNRGIYFDWGPDSQSYHAHIDSMPQKIDPLDILRALSEPSAQPKDGA